MTSGRVPNNVRTEFMGESKGAPVGQVSQEISRRTAQPTCVACGGCEVSGRVADGSYSYEICAACGQASLRPLPSPDDALSLYGVGYFEAGANAGYPDYGGDEPLHRKNARRRLAIVRRSGFAPPGMIIDVGCAYGYFLDEARQLGWRVIGVEASDWARREARDHFGIDVMTTLEEVADAHAGEADVVSFFGVLEHVPRPDELLAVARRCLRPGGLVVIETWDRGSAVARLMGAHWQVVTPPSVIHLFERESLRRLLDRGGFDVRSIRPAIKLVSPRAALSILRTKFPRASRALDRLVDWRALGRVAIPYAPGDLVTITAGARA